MSDPYEVVSDERRPDGWLDQWDGDELVRALRAPGTPRELAGEERYVAAFRDTRTARTSRSNVSPLRRGVRRLGTGGTAIVIAVGLSGGVAAAAYTNHLPDPVQRVVHEALGAPAPEVDRTPDAAPHRPRHTPPASQSPTTAPASPSTSPATPTPTPTEAPTEEPTRAPTSAPTGAPTGEPPTPSATPTAEPTEEPTPTATPTPPPPVPATVTMAGTSHRAAPGEAVTLSGTVTAADGTPVPGQPVHLQVRGPGRWRTVADATADASGAVSFSTPPAEATARYRILGAPRVRSEVWRVVLVPTLSATASGDEISATAAGGRPGDVVRLFRQGPHRLLAAGRDRLDQDGHVTFVVDARSTTTTYAVRLLATTAHARAATRLTVAPVTPASVSITAPAHEVAPGGSLSISGVVRTADGAPLAARDVVLQVRGPQRWRAVGTATTDADGAVALATPALDQTAVYRLRTGGVASDRWKVALVPTLQAVVTPGDPADIAVTTTGGRPGDTVSLLRLVGGKPVVVMRTTLAGDGTAHFQVTPGKRITRYVVRLLPTAAHAAAKTPTTVPAGRRPTVPRASARSGDGRGGTRSAPPTGRPGSGS